MAKVRDDGVVEKLNGQGVYEDHYSLVPNKEGVLEIYIGSLRLPKIYEGCKIQLQVKVAKIE